MPTKMQAVLFDLDGTLLDTAGDLGFALNHLLLSRGLETQSIDSVREMASHGLGALLKLGFNLSDEHPELLTLRNEFMDVYKENIALTTQLFPGMSEVLEYLEDNQISWGIVTNKPTLLTKLLLNKLNLNYQAGCVICGDTLPVSKPNPEPLLHACQLLEVSPDKCVYIGDAWRDIEAGRRAGMKTMLANYGYLSPSDKVNEWGADSHVQNPTEILSWLKNN